MENEMNESEVVKALTEQYEQKLKEQKEEYEKKLQTKRKTILKLLKRF